MLRNEISKRNLPDVFKLNSGMPCIYKEQWEERRKEIKELLCRNFAGFMPDIKTAVEGIIIKEDTDSFGGKAIKYDIELRVRSPFSYISFPFTLTIPKVIEKPSVFLNLAFTPVVADGFGEEILDYSFAIASVYYQDIAPDKEDDFQGGAGRYCTRNRYDSWGKLAMWAWGASRIMDYLQTLNSISTDKIAVIGHSRLGKAALWCGAMDERFSLVIANDSGAGGAALFRGKTGERIENLAGKGSKFWFCGNFSEYVNREEDLPFDQHFLLALIAPRNVYVSSASQDTWADPVSEFLTCIAVSPVYERFGKKGLVSKDMLPGIYDYFHEGKIGYHLRDGTHYLSRYDWKKFIDYRIRHRV